MDDGMGVPFFTQNARVHVPSADIVGKNVFYATVAGGKSIANAKPIEAGQGVVAADLSVTITTGPNYPDGPRSSRCSSRSPAAIWPRVRSPARSRRST